jgi:glucosamine-6-phosphate deaminase
VGPRIFVATDDAELARLGAELVVEALRAALEERDGEVLVTMSAGETPSGIYRALAAHHARTLPWSRVRLVQMDEWCGVGPDDARSFARELRDALVLPLGMAATTLDGRASPDAVLAIEEDVLARGGFALALHGIGTNGHLGFNEPPALSASVAVRGSALDTPEELLGALRASRSASVARRVVLAESTRRAASARWTERGGLASAALAAPAEGLTLGLRSLADAKRTLLVARGAHKAAALGAALARPDAACPASFVPRTGGTDVLVDRAAFAGFMEGSSR